MNEKMNLHTKIHFSSFFLLFFRNMQENAKAPKKELSRWRERKEQWTDEEVATE